MTDPSTAANMPVTTAFDFPHWETERYVGLMRAWIDAQGGCHYVPEAHLGPEP